MKMNHNIPEMKIELFDSDNHLAGAISYEPKGPDHLAATHTVVFPEYKGLGYAKLLLDALIDYAKAENKKILPVCSYVEHMGRKFPEEYGDMIILKN